MAEPGDNGPPRAGRPTRRPLALGDLDEMATLRAVPFLDVSPFETLQTAPEAADGQDERSVEAPP